MPDLRDWCAVLGVLLVGLGLWLIWIPLALLGVGGLLLVAAVSGHFRDGGRESDPKSEPEK